ncbi:MAG: DUF4080 domain-containing protein [Planctomycetes bacterium]|nr:DUF4080 domain-containing protein [Planctomycetota bacterium]
MPEILLTTLNAKYPHCAFGLRYLFANLGDLQPRAELIEFTINDAILEVLDAVVSRDPKIVGLGVYIWNIDPATRLVAALKQLRPDIVVVLGGPEVSFEVDEQPIVQLADYVITGEGDLEFAKLCRPLLEGVQPAAKIIAAELPRLDELALPYDFYSDEDIAHRVIYVEASRGCPFTCEFCLSALDIPVRQFPLEPFLAAMQRLLDRGCQAFKFVDRTFNLNPRVSRAILQFFLDRMRPGLFLHFEMIPDRLPESLRELIVQFPPAVLQFEVGVQTFNDQTAELISRRQDNEQLAANFRFLREQTGVHIHADLIAGLPGETLGSFAAGFDRLLALGPQEIQVGILKRLRGTPIIRHDSAEQMIYSPAAPYEVLSTRVLSAADLGRLRRFARVWDLLGNSGNFVESLPLLWRDESPFWTLWRLTDWLYIRLGRFSGIPLLKLTELVFEFATTEVGDDADELAPAMLRDYQRGGRSDTPTCLRGSLSVRQTSVRSEEKPSLRPPPRQSRHSTSSRHD